MFHMVGYNNRMYLLSVLKLWMGYTVRVYRLRYAKKTKSICMWGGVRGRGASAMWSMVGDATSCEVLGVIA